MLCQVSILILDVTRQLPIHTGIGDLHIWESLGHRCGMAVVYLDVFKHPVSTPIMSGIHPLWTLHYSVFIQCVHPVGNA